MNILVHVIWCTCVCPEWNSWSHSMLLFSIIGHARAFCEESGPILHNHHHFKSIRGPPYVSLHFILLFCKILFFTFSCVGKPISLCFFPLIKFKVIIQVYWPLSHSLLCIKCILDASSSLDTCIANTSYQSAECLLTLLMASLNDEKLIDLMKFNLPIFKEILVRPHFVSLHLPQIMKAFSFAIF